MKKSLLVLTTLLVSMTLMAGNVTEQEALRKAQQFMQGRCECRRPYGGYSGLFRYRQY